MTDENGRKLNSSKSPYIPKDSYQNRQKFLAIRGVDKYLGKQYAAMCNLEELRCMKHNMGKSHVNQRTIDQFIKPTYAY